MLLISKENKIYNVVIDSLYTGQKEYYISLIKNDIFF